MMYQSRGLYQLRVECEGQRMRKVSDLQADSMELDFIDRGDLLVGPLFARLEANNPMHGQHCSLLGSTQAARRSQALALRAKLYLSI